MKATLELTPISNGQLAVIAVSLAVMFYALYRLFKCEEDGKELSWLFVALLAWLGMSILPLLMY